MQAFHLLKASGFATVRKIMTSIPLHSYLDLRVCRDEADVEPVPGVVVPEHGREDLVADPGVRVAARGRRVAHGHVVATHGLLQVGERHIVLWLNSFCIAIITWIVG